MEIIHTILHPIFAIAVRDDIIRKNPSDGVMAEIKKSHAWEKPKRHALTVAQQNAFINYMKSSDAYSHWLPIFTVLLGTGCRIGELIGLRWEDCDFTKNEIEINHNLIYRKQDTDEGNCNVVIPSSIKAVETSALGSSIYTHSPNVKVAKAYEVCAFPEWHYRCANRSKERDRHL